MECNVNCTHFIMKNRNSRVIPYCIDIECKITPHMKCLHEIDWNLKVDKPNKKLRIIE